MQERIGYLKLETGNWKLETGNWKLETGNWNPLPTIAGSNPQSRILNSKLYADQKDWCRIHAVAL